MPAELIEGGTFASMVAGALGSSFEQAGVVGTVEIEGANAARGVVTIKGRYRPQTA